MRSRMIPVVALLALAGAAGCGGDSSTASKDAPATSRITVVATTTQVQDFVKVIAGDKVTLVGLLKPNIDPHDFEPGPAEQKSLAEAEVIVKNGVGLDKWLDAAVKAADTSAKVIDASAGVTLREGGDEHATEHSAGASETDHAAEHSAGASETDHAAEHSAGETAGGDPHIWHNPLNAKIMVDNITTALVAADAANAATYQANQTAYNVELDALDAEIQSKINTLTNKKLVTNHDAFGYYVDRYGLEFVGAVIPSFDTSAEPSAADVTDLVAQIKDAGVKAIFAESSLAPSLTETIGRDAGVTVVEGDDSLYGDTLGPVGSAGETYLKMMRHNTETIVNALK